MKILKTEDVDFSKSLMFYGTVKSIEEKEYGQIKIIFEPRDYHGQLFEDVYILADPEEPSDDSLLVDLLESTAWYQELEYDENNELEFSIEDLRKHILGIEVCLRIGFAGGKGIVLGISSCVGNLYGWGFLPESPIGPVRFITASEEPQSFIIFDEELCEAKGKGCLCVYDDADKKNILAKLPIEVNDKKNYCKVKDPINVSKKISTLYFEYQGKGDIDFYSFELI